MSSSGNERKMVVKYDRDLLFGRQEIERIEKFQ